MAPSFSARLSLHVILLSVDLLLLSSVVTPSPGCYSAIFNFGDSLTDTGNLAFLTGGKAPASRPPYGETYFHRPTGRFTDGRIILDFIARAMRLPLVPPYPAGRGRHNFAKGANFAVAGARALSNAFYVAEGFNWFDQLLQSSSPSALAAHDILKQSLFMVGEIGINDYNHVLLDDRPIDSVRAYVAPVVHAIASAIDVIQPLALVRTGAKTVMASGMFPVGCIPVFLAKFRTQDAEAYDPATGCLKWLNEFSQHHNLLLRRQLGRLRQAHPHATIVYADIYGALMSIYASPRRFGMTSPLMACCGGEGPYHFNFSVGCGDPTSTWCGDPWSYVCWDGKHLTEEAYHLQPRPAVDLPPMVDSSITDQFMLTDLQALVRAGAKTVLVSGIFPMDDVDSGGVLWR
ncbi:lipid catabolic process [Musa troglodytarum]|nr:lipid catabolic process [Musa troglodytarum]